jgi:hypothetical protein
MAELERSLSALCEPSTNPDAAADLKVLDFSSATKRRQKAPF